MPFPWHWLALATDPATPDLSGMYGDKFSR